MAAEDVGVVWFWWGMGMELTPLYTGENVKAAYQLLYSLTVYWQESPGGDAWLAELSSQCEVDGIRILEHCFSDVVTSRFLISALPRVRPVDVPARVKGRLQHLLKHRVRRPFRRNYDLTSVGSTQGEKVENYVAAQVEHHSDGGLHVPEEFADLQWIDPEVDLFRPRFTAHGRCLCNLHVVLVHRERAEISDDSVWIPVRDMIRRWAARKEHLLSRAGILPDHLHLTLGWKPQVSPIDLATSLMNNLAWVHGMKDVYMPSCFTGTFGKYDLGAIHKRLAEF